MFYSAQGKQEVLQHTSRSTCDTIAIVDFLHKAQLPTSAVDCLRFFYLTEPLSSSRRPARGENTKFFFSTVAETHSIWHNCTCKKNPDLNIAFTGKRILVNVTFC